MKNEIFEANPNLDLYYETADGSGFFTENAAQTHANSLTDKTVTLQLRSQVAPVEVAPVEVAPVEVAPVEVAPVETIEVAPVAPAKKTEKPVKNE